MISFYFEVVEGNRVNFNGKTTTFTLTVLKNLITHTYTRMQCEG